MQPTLRGSSYMWGSLERPNFITLNNKTVSIGRNLWNALVSLRLKDKARTIWVDALCINQEDLIERNEQVLVMSRIYREATRVLIYLGESSNDTDAAFSSFATVRRSLAMPWIPVAKVGTEEAKALMALCYRPYWRRVWIVQEILAASELEIICGGNSMEWGSFREALLEITSGITSSTSTNNGDLSRAVLSSHYLEEVKNACAVSPAAAIIRVHHGTSGTYSLRELLELCSACDSQCKDVRDKIYGLLSLCRDVGNHLIPDYTKTPSQLYLDVLVTWLGHSIVATIDERPDLLPFLANLQRILHDPLWNKAKEAFDPMHRLGRSVQLSRLQTTLRQVWIEELDKIVGVGPLITSNDRTIGIDYAESNWKVRAELGTLRDSIVNLSPRQFHQTDGFNARYHLHANDSSFYISLTLEELNILCRTRSTGQCSVFLTASGYVGLASHGVRENDILCHTLGIDDLFIIIRTRTDGSGFHIIGRALILRLGIGGSHISKLTSVEATASKLLHPIFPHDKSAV